MKIDMEWISVKDRLPEDGESVVYCIYSKIGEDNFMYSVSSALHQNGTFLSQSTGHYVNPTHWAVKPKPPTE